MKETIQYSDNDLVQKVLYGETKLYELIIRRYNSYLYKIGRLQHYNHEDTQDLMQDTYIDAFNGLKAFEYRSSFKTWLIKIMLHNCYRKRQKWNYQHIISAEINEGSKSVFIADERLDTNKTVMTKELNTIMEDAILHIPSDYRMVFTLREVNGLNVKETAEALSISEANVKVRLNRAKAMLRKELTKSYSAEEVFEFNLIYCDAVVDKVMNRIKEIMQ
ncbi:MAG: sigma-70 family RNA polymerase sigma factor [Bacteroidales bacterium]|nr:sigma-70 family RNA polymerase sigma factor [Bacteroidales bacterium]